MKYDVIVIGAGLSGLTAASLLAKRGLSVALLEQSADPGGSCGIFKRDAGQTGDQDQDSVIFDQGSAMLFGFGEKGFNAHRFVFNCLEESIRMIRHDLLYCVNFNGHRIRFWPDIDRFAEELSLIFPSQGDNIRRFYGDLFQMYQHIMVEEPAYTTADETDRQTALKSMLKHPASYLKFLSYLNQSAEQLLKRYFTDPEIFKFFDKLTSTYCYTTVKESPAVLASVMFVDNHAGGSYYPAGSTLFLPGRLEKSIEEHGGEMIYGAEAVEILFEQGSAAGAKSSGLKAAGVRLSNGETIRADHVVFSGTVWNLYGKLIPGHLLSEQQKQWAKNLVPTYPSVVLYAYVDREAIPGDTAPVELLVGNPDRLDESEVTVYLFSIDDQTLCPEDGHVLMAIGPSFETWDHTDRETYRNKKEKEKQRLVGVLERRFPGISTHIRLAEVATPCTIERYTLKNGGAVAGPKQMLGQHMFKRLHTRSQWENLYFCGESTVMGTGTPTVTTSGISAANAILKKEGLQPFVHEKDRKEYVTILDHPFTREDLFREYPEDLGSILEKSARCLYCEHPACSRELDVRGILRRLTVGNLAGAAKVLREYRKKLLQNRGQQPDWEMQPDKEMLLACQNRCIRGRNGKKPVEIAAILSFLLEKESTGA